MMQFCECGGMVVSSGEAVKCRNCGKAQAMKAQKITTHSEKKATIVIEDNKPDLPETDVQCPKCGHARAYWWLIQTRSSDEPPTQFYKCTKCKHTWREYK